MVKFGRASINAKLAIVATLGLAFCLSAGCAPRASLSYPSTANPIEIIDRSPRIYHIGFQPIADSIAAERLMRYIEYGFISEYPEVLVETSSDLSDSAKELANAEFAEAAQQAQAGSLSVAMDHLRKSLDSDPTFKPAYLLLADLLLEQGRLKEAFKVYMRLLPSDMRDSRVLVGLARCMMMLGDLDNARKALVDAIIFDRANLEAWEDLRFVARAQKQELRIFDAPELAFVRKRRGRHFDIVVDKSLEDCPSLATAWIVYASQRAVWRYESKFKRSTGLTKYRRTYEEDIDCYMALVAAWNVLSREDTTLCHDDYLEYVGKITDEGYLVPHVLFDYICVERPDAARSFSGEAIQRIRDYINRYVIVPKG